MKERKLVKTLAVAIVLMLLASMAPAIVSAQTLEKDKKEKDKFAPGEILVKLKGEEKYKKIKVSPGSELKELEKYSKNKNVEFLSLNYIVNISSIPNDPEFLKLWGMDNIGQTGGTPDADIDAPEAWDIQTGSGDVIVAVIDTGVDYNHPDLAANIWTNAGEIPGNGIDDDQNGFADDVHGIDTINDDSDPMDDHGHGTHVAGTIAAVGNNGIGVVGVIGINPNVKIMAVKFLGADGSGYLSDAIDAINYAKENGANVMSNSWGGGGYSDLLKSEITSAIEKGIVFIAAAGNSGSDNDFYPAYPANYPGVISVAATDHNDQIAYFSSYGRNTVHLGAPGVDIYSTVPYGSCSLCSPTGYNTLSGTSMATPHVSGAIASIISEFPELKGNVAAITARLLGGVDQIPSLSEKTVAGGRLNILNTLETDLIPPAAISDLNVSSTSIMTATLTWTAPGDNGMTGKASAYIVRYGPAQDFQWDTATQLTGIVIPKEAGSTETLVVSGLNPDTEYSFAIKAIDNVGNLAEISNVATGKTKISTVVMGHDFENGLNGWTTSGNYVNWQLGSSTIIQAHSGANLWGTNLNGNYQYNNMVESLISPTFSLKNLNSAMMQFWHYYSTESHYDGGVVEISTNGGSSWSQIEPVNGYPEDALSSFNPLGTVPAYSGRSGQGWTEDFFDLSSYIGNDNIKIRFTFATDYSIYYYEGWYIDDVYIIGETAEIYPPPPINHPPVAGNLDVIMDEDNSIEIILPASDPDDRDVLRYEIVSYPQSGTVTLDQDFAYNGRLTYAPCENCNGLVSLSYRVFDELVHSELGIAQITVTPVNDAPVANPQNVETNESAAVNIVLTGSDIDSNTLQYRIVSYPTHGTLVPDSNFALNGKATYNPDAGFVGTDSVTYAASDGELESDPATVNINVVPVPKKCWDASYGYLFNNPNQAKKFAKCAYGSYEYSQTRKLSQKAYAYKYADSGNNQNWTVIEAGLSQKPIYEIKSPSGQWYPTDVDYYLP